MLNGLALGFRIPEISRARRREVLVVRGCGTTFRLARLKLTKTKLLITNLWKEIYIYAHTYRI